MVASPKGLLSPTFNSDFVYFSSFVKAFKMIKVFEREDLKGFF